MTFSSLSLTTYPNIRGINKHFIVKHTYKVIILLKQKQNSINFLTACRSEWPAAYSVVMMLPMHKKHPPFISYNWSSRECTNKDFSDVNEQVVRHQYSYYFVGFTFGFKKEKEKIPFQCSISSWPHGKEGFIPANSLSLKTWRKSANHCYSHHQPWYRCLENAKMEKWNKEKTLKNKFCINEK